MVQDAAFLFIQAQDLASPCSPSKRSIATSFQSHSSSNSSHSERYRLTSRALSISSRALCLRDLSSCMSIIGSKRSTESMRQVSNLGKTSQPHADLVGIPAVPYNTISASCRSKKGTSCDVRHINVDVAVPANTQLPAVLERKFRAELPRSKPY